MRQIVRDGDDFRFCGSIENTEDTRAALDIAGQCPKYCVDEEEEDYCEGERICFNCRYRRWLADGFQCTKGFLRS